MQYDEQFGQAIAKSEKTFGQHVKYDIDAKFEQVYTKMERNERDRTSNTDVDKKIKHLIASVNQQISEHLPTKQDRRFWRVITKLEHNIMN